MYCNKKYIISVVLALVLIASGVFVGMRKNIVIVYGNLEIKTSVWSGTVVSALRAQNIELSRGDETSKPTTDKLKNGDRIAIIPAKTVVLNDEDTPRKLKTAKGTVGEAIAAWGIALDEITILTDEKTPIEEGMSIDISRTAIKTEVVEEPLAFRTVTKRTTELAPGTSRIISDGEDGSQEATYSVTYFYGEETNRRLVAATTITEPQDKVVEYGVTPAILTGGGAIIDREGGTLTTAGGKILNYSGTIDVTAYSYTTFRGSTGRTATGMRAQRGVIAVDPKVIPLGTRVYVESPNGSWTYGEAIAADTGGSIKGSKIDLFVESESEARRFGVKSARVYILE